MFKKLLKNFLVLTFLFAMSTATANAALYYWIGESEDPVRSVEGTVSVSTGSDIVTGTGTNFEAEFSVNDYILVDADGVDLMFQIDSIDSETQITLKSDYSPEHSVITGNVSFSYNSTSVTGSGTSFLTELSVGDFVYPTGYASYAQQIASIEGDEALTLSAPYMSSSRTNVVGYYFENVVHVNAAASKVYYDERLRGTVEVENGNNIVTGSGTTFTNYVQPGDAFYILNEGSSKLETVASVDSNTQITLTNAYSYADQSGVIAHAYHADCDGTFDDGQCWSTSNSTGGAAPANAYPNLATDDASFNNNGPGDCLVDSSFDIDAVTLSTTYPGTMVVSGDSLVLDGRFTIFSGGMDLSAATTSLTFDDMTFSGYNNVYANLILAPIDITLDRFYMGNSNYSPTKFVANGADLSATGAFEFTMQTNTYFDLSTLSGLYASYIKIQGTDSNDEIPDIIFPDTDIYLGYWDRYSASSIDIDMGQSTLVFNTAYDSTSNGLDDLTTHFYNVEIDKPEIDDDFKFVTNVNIDGELEIKKGRITFNNGQDFNIGRKYSIGLPPISGTVTFTNGSSTVTGVGTSFLTDLSVGDYVYPSLGSSDNAVTIDSIESDTSLTLTSSFSGATQEGDKLIEKTIFYGGTGRPELILGEGTGELFASSNCPLNGLANCRVQYLDGDVELYILNKTLSVSPEYPEVLRFGSNSGDQVLVNYPATLQGYDALDPLYLRSDSEGVQWDFDTDNTLTVSYLDVKDSNNISTVNDPIQAYGFDIVDSGNNDGWAFSPPPSDPTNLGPSGYLDGSPTKDRTPTFDFTLSATTDVQYRIQVWENDNTDTLVVDYTSPLDTDGVKSFTVGQDDDGGTYAVGEPGQLLDADDSQEYYFQVMAINDEGVESNWVDSKVGDFGFYMDFVGPLPPELTYPINGEISASQPTFTWEDLTDEVKYTLEISDDPTFATYVQRIDNIPQNSTSVQASSALADGVYYWRVWGTDTLNNEDPEAATINKEDFYAGIHAPEIPVIADYYSTRGNNTTTRRPNFKFFLDDVASSVWLKFRVQIATDAAFNNLVVDYTSVYERQRSYDVYYSVGSISYPTTWKYPADDYVYTVGSPGMELADGAYYFRVKALNEVAESDWAVANGGDVSVYIDNEPYPPFNLGPDERVDGSYATNHDLEFEFITDSPGYNVDLRYRIVIDNNSDFSSPEVDYVSVSSSMGAETFTLGQAENEQDGIEGYIHGSEGQTLADGLYYWKVKALNDYNPVGESAYTDANLTGAFVVNTETPNVPVNLDSPSFNEQDVTTDTTPQLNFDLGSATVDLPLAYRVQIDDSSDFSSLLIDYTSAKSEQGTLDFTVGQAEGSGTYDVNEISELTPGVYYWRVKAINNPESDWGDGGSFEVDGDTPPIVPEFSDYMFILMLAFGAAFILNQRYQLIEINEK